MKKLLLIGLLAIGIKSSAQTSLFTQDFSASTSVNYYINANNPTNGFNYLIRSNSPTANISIENKKLIIDKTSSGESISFVRNTDFQPVPLVVKLEVDVEFQNTTEKFNSGALSFEFGQNYNSTTAGLISTTTGSTVSHSVFTFILTNEEPIGFKIRKLARSSAEVDATVYTGQKRITFVANNSGDDFQYTGPDGLPRTIANDKNDIWVGDRLVFGNADARVPTAQLTDFRMNTATDKTKIFVGNMVITSLKDTPPLPVTLTSFTGKAQNKAVVLNWATASEQNNKSFTLLRSHDGKTFEEIAKIDGAGNSATVKNYSYTDENPYPGVNYYQLQQEDFNGDRQEPVVIAVDSKISTAQLSVYTDAKGLTVNIVSPNHTNGNIQLYNISGQQLHSQSLALIKGHNTLYLPSLASNSIYFIRYVANGKVVHQKFKL